MKRLLFGLVFMLLTVGFISAGTFTIEVKGGYFFPSDSYFKEIYGEGITYGAEIGANLLPWAGLWAGGDYFSGRGKMTFTGEDTRLQIIPVYGGIKFFLPNSNLSPYIGGGIGYFMFQESTPVADVNDGDIGYIGQIGVLVKVWDRFFLDIKGSYTFCEVKPLDISAELGGLHICLALGMEF